MSRAAKVVASVAVDDLTSGPGGYIYAATHGRGVWRFKL